MSDSLAFNKYAGAVLATCFVIAGLVQLSGGVFGDEKVAKPGFKVEVAEETGGGEVADVPPDWGTVLPKADVAAGQATFAKCQSCHSLTANGTGPNLTGVVGRHPATEAGFNYSDGMKAFGAKQPVWDYDHLYMFLKGPQAYVNGTKMTFVGLKQPQDRINVIAFLRTQGGTLPIPKPNPAAAAAPAGPAGAPAAGAADVAKSPGPSGAPGVGGASAGTVGAKSPVATGSTATPAAGAGGPTNTPTPPKTDTKAATPQH
ncbi:MAG TPA: cytochrome c family protein [Phenylobacterium sp.]|jgi:cytochrome c|uniref:c-type cytochrome n=1 Tax=Phenylobacterium sp. TaxID=1871053 RepID=UPI002D5A7784|nr:cytochrome c family protein [Phenylobacterium sp.]HZZ69603.1 cytochrome c family protein [Phenylobacterium sp.]